MGEKSESVMVPRELLARVDVALTRWLHGSSPRRIPAENTDADLLLSEVKAMLSAAPQPSPRADAGQPASGRRELVERLRQHASDLRNPGYIRGKTAVDDLLEAATALSEAGERWTLANSTPADGQAAPMGVRFYKMDNAGRIWIHPALPPLPAAPAKEEGK